MKLQRETIKYKASISSLCWDGEQLIDWVEGGKVYKLNGETIESSCRYAYDRLDAAIQFIDGDDHWAVTYEKLGTKGLVLKNGKIVREINRSFYQADVYEYPIAFLRLKNGKIAIAHCPDEYNILEIEDALSGKRMIRGERDREKIKDCFFSRLRINRTNTHLLHAGWHWSPVDIMEFYSIEEIMKNPTKEIDEWRGDDIYAGEVVSAEFLGDRLLLLATLLEDPDDYEVKDEQLKPSQIGLYDIKEKKFMKRVSIDFNVGRLIPLNEEFALSLYEYPKLVDLNSGLVTQSFTDLKTGKQDSSIIRHLEDLPVVAVDTNLPRVALVTQEGIEVFTLA